MKHEAASHLQSRGTGRSTQAKWGGSERIRQTERGIYWWKL